MREHVRHMKIAFILAGAVLLLASSVYPGGTWDLATSQTLMRQSGRPVSLTQAQFTELQDRKPAYIRKIETYLQKSLGGADPRVVSAFEAVPREYFMYNYEKDRSLAESTYETTPGPGPWDTAPTSATTGPRLT